MTGLTNRARLDLIAQEIRLATQITERCLWCDWNHTGLLAETRDAYAEHRTQAHPEWKPPRRRHKPRPGSWPISNKPVDENIAGVRAQGGARWDGAGRNAA